MPRQNRVTPGGELLAVPDRGLFWGNRGNLHDPDGTLVRWSRGRAWVVCVLEFRGRHRELWAPGRLTELFFLDEATALAAGHRPCGECRIAAHRAYRTAWATAHPDDPVSAPAIDARLHADRMGGPRTRCTYRERLDRLPDGAVVDLDGRPWLVHGPDLLAWTAGGYTERRHRVAGEEVLVITPRSTVATLTAGYQPVLHPSALDPHQA